MGSERRSTKVGSGKLVDGLEKRMERWKDKIRDGRNRRRGDVRRRVNVTGGPSGGSEFRGSSKYVQVPKPGGGGGG